MTGGEMMEDLSRRAVACKGWRWMPGMLALFLDEDEDPPVWVRERVQWVESPRSFWPVRSGRPVRATVYLPDITDPATLGCLLALVRDAHRDAFMAAGNDGPDWVVRDCDGYEVCRGSSERAVLVAALEAAE
jgi:hypothetical protein